MTPSEGVNRRCLSCNLFMSFDYLADAGEVDLLGFSVSTKNVDGKVSVDKS